MANVKAGLRLRIDQAAVFEQAQRLHHLADRQPFLLREVADRRQPVAGREYRAMKRRNAMKPTVLASTGTQVDYELYENHPLALRRAQGRHIACLAGVAWITACDEPADFFLHPGDVYIVPNGGLVLVEAVGRCRVGAAALHPLHGRLAAGLARNLKAIKPIRRPA
jgi:hypothetical protein